ncbi:MAG: allantoinase AllB [Aggregatilineales bacterium]
MTDLIIRNARVVDATRDDLADVAVQSGKIIDISPNIPLNIANEFDAQGQVLFPGGIDPHVHFNEPGRTDWEGFITGTKALAKGGMTGFFDMPLNSTPPTTTVDDFNAKQHLAEAHSLVNCYLWGGLIPGNLDYLKPLADRGVIGFKAFMSNSGMADFPAVDDYTLYRGMEIIAETGKILAVHAENDGITGGLAKDAQRAGKISARDYLESRPAIAEQEAISRAILMAEATGCKLHIVHVSSARGVEMVMGAQARGVDVTCETCPHYLVLTDEDVIRLGASAKCAPPIRDAEEQAALWELVMSGDLPIIASDHSPAPPDIKTGDDFFAIWGGISSCQSTLSLLLTFGHHQLGMSLQQITAVTSTNTANRFGLEHKGKLIEGADADMTLVDIHASYTLTADDLEYRHKISPYIGMTLRGQVNHTWVGGEHVYGG